MSCDFLNFLVAGVPTGTWVWSKVTKGWQWQEAGQSTVDSTASTSGNTQNSQGSGYSTSGQNSGNGNNYDSGYTDSGWITLPNGTRTRSYSSWSSSSSSVEADGSTGFNRGGGKGIKKVNFVMQLFLQIFVDLWNFVNSELASVHD